MGYNVEKIFEDVDYLSRVRTSKDYETNINMFEKKRYDLLVELIHADDVRAEAEIFCNDVSLAFKKFGKVRGKDMMSLNYFMIYYVFPTILKNEENAKDICDAIKDVWNGHFKANISYTDFDSLMDGFQTKIFGIPVGKN